MAAEFSDQDRLDAVKKSPAACAVHDKATWLSLFAADGSINDPHGSAPHNHLDARERFYETFIAPNGIHFDVNHDIVCGDTVVRDVTIQTTLSTGLVVDVPTHIRYRLIEDNGVLKVAALHAHWELLPMVLGTLKTGWQGFVSYGKLTVHMLKHQGLGGMLGFMRGFIGVGRAGKTNAETFLKALSEGDVATATTLMADQARFFVPGVNPARLQDLAAALPKLSWDKLTAAGDTVTATTFVERAGQTQRGVIFLRMNSESRRICEASLYF